MSGSNTISRNALSRPTLFVYARFHYFVLGDAILKSPRTVREALASGTDPASIQGKTMIKTSTCAALVALALAPCVVQAADADFCFTAPYEIGRALTDSHTIFKCPVAGNHTISELAKAGWEPVSINTFGVPAPPGQPIAGTRVQERLLIVKK